MAPKDSSHFSRFAAELKTKNRGPPVAAVGFSRCRASVLRRQVAPEVASPYVGIGSSFRGQTLFEYWLNWVLGDWQIATVRAW